MLPDLPAGDEDGEDFNNKDRGGDPVREISFGWKWERG